MLQLKPICESCGKSLPPNDTEAMICSFECTFCKTCVDDVLQNVCPNCGGGFEKRPIRPQRLLEKYPASELQHFKHINMAEFKILLDKNKTVAPKDR